MLLQNDEYFTQRSVKKMQSCGEATENECFSQKPLAEALIMQSELSLEPIVLESSEVFSTAGHEMIVLDQ